MHACLCVPGVDIRDVMRPLDGNGCGLHGGRGQIGFSGVTGLHTGIRKRAACLSKAEQIVLRCDGAWGLGFACAQQRIGRNV